MSYIQVGLEGKIIFNVIPCKLNFSFFSISVEGNIDINIFWEGYVLKEYFFDRKSESVRIEMWKVKWIEF